MLGIQCLRAPCWPPQRAVRNSGKHQAIGAKEEKDLIDSRRQDRHDRTENPGVKCRFRQPLGFQQKVVPLT